MIYNGYFGTNGMVASSSTYKSIIVPCLPNTVYTISKQKSVKFSIGTTQEYPVNKTPVDSFKMMNSAEQMTLMTNANAKYLVAYVYTSAEDTITFDELASTIQVEFEGRTPYETYKEYRATAKADGTVEGLKSISPKMSIYSNIDANIELTYNKSWGVDYENEAWWNNITRHGARKDYEYGFYGWNCEYLHPPFKIIPEYVSAQEQGRTICMFANNRYLLKVEKEYFDLSKCTYSNTTQTNGQYCVFRNCTKLKYIEDIGFKAGYMYGTYMNCSELETIEIQRIDKTTLISSNTFQSCSSLKNITFEGEIGKSINFSACPLSKTSITNIVEHLCVDTDVTGQTLTLKESAVNEVFTTEEWAALEATKPNWTITLV